MPGCSGLSYAELWYAAVLDIVIRLVFYWCRSPGLTVPVGVR